MTEFEVKRTSKKCSKTERPLLPGEQFFSALVEVGDDTQRLDFSAEAWSGPPQDCLGWWKATIPEEVKGKIYWAPRAVLLAYFDHLTSQPNQADVAYMVALLLVQKKVLHLEETLEEPDSQILAIKNRHSNENYRIPVIEISPARLAEIQNELSERLFLDQPYDLEGDAPDPAEE